MRGIGISVAARASMLALAVSALGSPETARASAKHSPATARRPFHYDTAGVVDAKAAPGSITGPQVLQFQGVSGATLTPGSQTPIQLGQFVVPASAIAAANGQATTYDHTPFEVQIHAPEFDKTSSVPLLSKVFPKFGRSLSLKTVDEASLLIHGQLNGTVSPAGQSSVIATVDSIRPGGLEAKTQDHIVHYSFPVRFGDLKLPPSWSLTTMTTPPKPAAAAAQTFAAEATPTPEPSTLGLFAAILGGLALARRRAAR